MGLFGPPNIEKMKANGDLKGIIKTLEYRKDVAVRLQAIEMLAELKAPETVEPLIALLKEEDPIRTQAANALGEIGDRRALDGLLACVLGDDYVPEAVINVLAKLDYKGSVDSLVSNFSFYEGSLKRCRIVKALGRLGGKHAVEALLSMALDKNRDVSRVAVEALGATGSAAIPALISMLVWEGEKRNAATFALLQMGQRAIEPLTETLRGDGWETKSPIVAVLKKLFWQPPPGSDAEIIFHLVDEQWESLVKAGGAAVPHLRSALGHGFWNYKVMEVLGRIGGKEAFEALLPMLDYHGLVSDEIRAEAARILGQAGWQPTADENGARYWILTGHCEECVKIGVPAIAPLADALGGDHKKEAAKALLQIHQNGGLGDAARKKILATRDTIMATHTDGHKDERWTPPVDCDIEPGHTDDHKDEGIGIDFPL